MFLCNQRCAEHFKTKPNQSHLYPVPRYLKTICFYEKQVGKHYFHEGKGITFKKPMKFGFPCLLLKFLVVNVSKCWAPVTLPLLTQHISRHTTQQSQSENLNMHLFYGKLRLKQKRFFKYLQGQTDKFGSAIWQYKVNKWAFFNLVCLVGFSLKILQFLFHRSR